VRVLQARGAALAAMTNYAAEPSHIAWHVGDFGVEPKRFRSSGGLWVLEPQVTGCAPINSIAELGDPDLMDSHSLRMRFSQFTG
jgi:hypothetical protein